MGLFLAGEGRLWQARDVGWWGGDAGVSLNVAKLQQQAAELDAELGQARYVGRSTDGVASAVVTGQGKLVDLTIADHVIRSSHPQRVGPAVMEAVSAARREASKVSVGKMRAVVDKDQEWYPESASAPATDHHDEYRPPPEPPVETVSKARGPHHTGEDVEEESFDQLDFLDDPLEDEERDRW